ncbi:Uncharacterised protein [Vibrio cholerae]|nr:Uncharacterised protein [Vibrio cholerae]CSI85971.1 Uncharacterised protein [Vibrio cholerae]
MLICIASSISSIAGLINGRMIGAPIFSPCLRISMGTVHIADCKSK